MHRTSCCSPSWLALVSSLMEEREMGKGASSRLETDSSLQRHSKGRFWCSEGTQPGIKDAGSQPGCWAAGVPWSTDCMGSASLLASLGLHFLICEKERIAPSYYEVLCCSVSSEHDTHACPEAAGSSTACCLGLPSP